MGGTPNFPPLTWEEACPNSPWSTPFHILEWEALYPTFMPKHKGCILVSQSGAVCGRTGDAWVTITGIGFEFHLFDHTDVIGGRGGDPGRGNALVS